MRTSRFFAAPVLQKGLGMKALGVLILSVVALSGCGVGADEPEGQPGPGTAATSQAMVVGSEWVQGRGNAPELKNDPVSLPFDPVPVTNLRPVVGVVR